MIKKNKIIECSCDEKLKILYVEISKAGNSSIKYELFIKPKTSTEEHKRFKDNYHLIHSQTKTLTWNRKKYKDYFKFTVVRDPLERFISAYKNKILLNESYIINNLGLKKYTRSQLENIDLFIDSLNEHSIRNDKHFTNQKFLIPRIKDMDLVGQLEKIEETEKILSKKVGQDISFEFINKSEEYTPKILNIEKFYYLYRKDYKLLKKFYLPPKINIWRYALVYITEKFKAIKYLLLNIL